MTPSSSRPNDLAADLLADIAEAVPRRSARDTAGASPLPEAPPAAALTPLHVQASVLDLSIQTTLQLRPLDWLRPALSLRRAGVTGVAGPIRIELTIKRADVGGRPNAKA